jgi:hypothetical protein
VTGCGPVTLAVASGPTVISGPTGTAFNLLLGSSVSLADVHDPHPRTARLWLAYTGATAGAVRGRCVEMGEAWDTVSNASARAMQLSKV